MINILEAVDLYDDTWLLTFYFVMGFSFIIGIAWTYYQFFVKRDKKNNKPLKENIIYNHSDDIIENYEEYPKKKEIRPAINNYQLRDFININEDIYDDTKEIDENEIHYNKNTEIEETYKEIDTEIHNKDFSDSIINEQNKSLNENEIEDPYKDISFEEQEYNNPTYYKEEKYIFIQNENKNQIQDKENSNTTRIEDKTNNQNNNKIKNKKNYYYKNKYYNKTNKNNYYNKRHH